MQRITKSSTAMRLASLFCSAQLLENHASIDRRTDIVSMEAYDCEGFGTGSQFPSVTVTKVYGYHPAA